MTNMELKESKKWTKEDSQEEEWIFSNNFSEEWEEGDLRKHNRKRLRLK